MRKAPPSSLAFLKDNAPAQMPPYGRFIEADYRTCMAGAWCCLTGSPRVRSGPASGYTGSLRPALNTVYNVREAARLDP